MAFTGEREVQPEFAYVMLKSAGTWSEAWVSDDVDTLNKLLVAAPIKVPLELKINPFKFEDDAELNLRVEMVQKKDVCP